ncbi:hypothetical protein IMG5_020680 [Ichthyophthirius multifiliis]|uniref:Transmembrane protein n=1 Tax=Ichthyophthirius multifiliis TaxID=5932 RepID=G0QKP9_ICHMU|nr:hypothetical protein IMG5_020680 [Ichthyophthirius multifiliis]EGR34203.1 hypothetical protein IMG5_020680 [Ichthyophthirius multifiliis]|eukprot:XP_004039507.1 hypothetical protein IMG5_020680 [Ichthyophthirius multifiliis]
MAQTILSRVFRKFDIFGSEVGLNFQKSTIFQTQFGALISLIFTSLMLLFFWNNFLQFFNKDTVNVKIDQSFDHNPSKINLNQKNFMFAVRVIQDDFINNPYFNISFYSRNRIFSEKHQNSEQIIEMLLEPCTLAHWVDLQAYNIDWKQVFDEKGLDQYLCPPLNEQYYVQGAWGLESYDQLMLKIKKCTTIQFKSEKWRPKCRKKEELEKIFIEDQNKYFEVEIFVPNYAVNPNLSKNYITSYLNTADLFFYIQPGKFLKKVELFLSEFNIFTDESLMPYEDINNQNFPYIQLSGFRESNLLGNYDEYLDIQINRSYYTNNIYRKFQKIDEIIAYVGGFAQAFLIFSAFLVSYYNEYIYMIELANKLYDFDLDEGNNVKKQNKNFFNIKEKQQQQYIQSINSIVNEKNKNVENINKNINNQQEKEVKILTLKQKKIQFQIEKKYKKKQYKKQVNILIRIEHLKYKKQYQYQQHQNNQNDKKDRKKFLAKEFEHIIQRNKSLQINIFYFINQITCGKFCRTKTVLLIEKAQEQIKKDLDIFNILNKIKEIEKFKQIFLTQSQMILFNFFPKTVIQVKENDTKELSRVFISEDRFKELAKKNTTQQQKMRVYLRLYEAYEEICQEKEKNEINNKLIDMLGFEMRNIFEKSKFINFKRNPILALKMNQQQSPKKKNNIQIIN